ncbi:phosphoglycerate kinase, partial [Candidatus Peregrinibacteria bacterium]|nr:phosphoglycerate kinase [Candidatus Peregrinibacteria bacterium]
KRVLVRVDHNIELNEKGVLKNDKKIRATLPTIQLLLDKKARVVLMTHVGRPKGKASPQLSTKHAAGKLRTLLPGVSITHIAEAAGPNVEAAAGKLKDGEILYIENVRFYAEEEGEPQQQADFAKRLAKAGDLFVNEAFASCHEYEEASTCAIARLLPGCMGIHFQKEIDMLSPILDDPRRPLVLIISGAKMETKIPVVEYFLNTGDDILLGGCIANTFIAARGFDVAKSKYEKEYMAQAQEMMLEADKLEKANIHVPRDAVVASAPTAEAARVDLPVEDIEGDMAIFDVGKVSAQRYADVIEKAGMILWNGPLGFYEVEQFSGATKKLAEAVAAATKRGAVTIVGGGDTIDFHTRYGYSLDAYTFVSTGGGAMLEFVSGKELPAIKALER